MRKVIGGLGAAALATAALVGVAPAVPAAEPLLVCTWIADSRDSQDTTWTCTKPRRSPTTAVFRDCWKNPPSELTHVKQRIPGGWVLADVPLRIERVPKACSKTHPWRTKVAVPLDGLVPYETVHYRMTMPATSGEYDGVPYSYGRTSLNLFACLVPEGSSRRC